VFLCATFGRQVVLPDRPALRSEFGDQEWIHYYDPSSGAPELASAIRVALAEPQRAEQAAVDFAASRPPWDLAVGFDRIVREIDGSD